MGKSPLNASRSQRQVSSALAVHRLTNHPKIVVLPELFPLLYKQQMVRGLPYQPGGRRGSGR